MLKWWWSTLIFILSPAHQAMLLLFPDLDRNCSKGSTFIIVFFRFCFEFRFRQLHEICLANGGPTPIVVVTSTSIYDFEGTSEHDCHNCACIYNLSLRYFVLITRSLCLSSSYGNLYVTQHTLLTYNIFCKYHLELLPTMIIRFRLH